tara:strand:- start:639 stop:800 length:162 start_codon:yes stop_codon:yes gene_type:complete
MSELKSSLLNDATRVELQRKEFPIYSAIQIGKEGSIRSLRKELSSQPFFIAQS